jgi:hypothetical protein
VPVAEADERPQLVECGDEPRLVLEAVEPHLRMHPVVDLLAVDLRGEAGELGVVGGLQLLEPERVRLLVEEVAGDRVLPARQPQLHEPGAAVLLGCAVEGELVGGRSELARGEFIQRSCMPDLVLGDRREGDVLLQEGRDPGPLRVAPAEDQLVVSDLEQQLCPLLHAPPSASP